jgi:nucleoside-diphosphate-sugar epimerase
MLRFKFNSITAFAPVSRYYHILEIPAVFWQLHAYGYWFLLARRILPVDMSSTQSKQSSKFPRTVVLGASGRLARLIRPFWKNAPVTWQSRAPMEGCTQVDIINDPAKLRTLLSGAETVICLAGVTPAPDANYSDNLLIGQACLDAAHTVGAGHVFLTSSAAVYGTQSGVLNETAQINPASEYGISKYQMEQMAAAHPHPSTCLRIGNVAGADAALGGWAQGAVMDQMPDGATPARSYIGPATLARVLQTLASAPNLPKLLNLSAPGSLQMGALLNAADRPFTTRPATKNTIANVTLDTSLLETIIPFSAQDSTATQMVQEWKQATGQT